MGSPIQHMILTVLTALPLSCLRGLEMATLKNCTGITSKYFIGQLPAKFPEIEEGSDIFEATRAKRPEVFNDLNEEQMDR